MKNFIKKSALFLVLISVTAAVAACSVSVSGKTFMFEDIEIINDGTMTPEQMEEERNISFDSSKGTGFVFGKDGTLYFYVLETDRTVSLNYFWRVEGNKVYIGPEKDFEIDKEKGSYFEVKGSVVVFVENYNGIIVKRTYKEKK